MASPTDTRASQFTLFATAPPGLEALTAQELRDLHMRRVATTPGGVRFRGSLRAIYLANLHLRTASRVLVRLGEFQATTFAELRGRARRLPWEMYLTPGAPAVLHVTCHKSRLYHSDAVAERVGGAIGDRLGQPTPLAKGSEETDAVAAPLVVVRLLRDRCTLSVDSSGALLHRRSYRRATAKAPLRETLAAAMLLSSEWDKRSPLMDPMCGSGTIPIEAALLATRTPPGRRRRFAFMDWPEFEPALWQSLCAEADAQAITGSSIPPILASDRDQGAIEAARQNAGRVGMSEHIHFSARAISRLEPPAGPGWMVTNPPYGVRVGGSKDLRNLYARFGQVLRARCPGWRVTLLSASPALARQVGLSFDEGVPIHVGGLRVKLLHSVVPGEEMDR